MVRHQGAHTKQLIQYRDTQHAGLFVTSVLSFSN